MTGLLLAGIGVSGQNKPPTPCHYRTNSIKKHVTDGPDAQRNFLVVDAKTETSAIEKAFVNFTQERNDIAVLLINQHVRCPLSPPEFAQKQWAQLFLAVCTYILLTKYAMQVAERIRHTVDSFADPFPAVLEIPSKDHPYDPEKDSVMKRVRRLFGE